MCTVTYIPAEDGFIISSSRDEQFGRPAAVYPAFHRHRGQEILYPKDGKAGGTWFAINENGNLLVFLNGALKKHLPADSYCKSRGLVLLDFISDESPTSRFEMDQLTGIEPFTAIIFESGRLLEARWDGVHKSVKECDKSQAFIWSSATLYNEAASRLRQSWFDEWLQNNPSATQEDAIEFHLTGGQGDTFNGIRVYRPGSVQTVSITSLRYTSENAVMDYIDASNLARSRTPINFTKEWLPSQ